MSELKIVPITSWIGKKTESPKRSQFQANYRNTIKLLKFELDKAQIYGDAQLQMFYRPEDMRLDGNLRANAKPYQQGVKLVFQRLGDRFFDEKNQKWKYKLKTVSYPCDAFDDWQDNLRAIALSMEKLRAVERYGVFKYADIMDRLALPSAEGKVSTRENAIAFIVRHSGHSFAEAARSEPILKQAFRAAALALHPDQNGGRSSEDFRLLQEARKTLGL